MRAASPDLQGKTLLRRAAPVALGGAALFLAACSLPNVGLFDGGSIGDVALYRTYGEAVAHGGVPYRDFFFE